MKRNKKRLLALRIILQPVMIEEVLDFAFEYNIMIIEKMIWRKVFSVVMIRTGSIDGEGNFIIPDTIIN